ncbi:hypothetical protein E4T56_gene14120, partial [Termitomyces sp. T112]
MPRLDGFGLIEKLRQGNRHRDRPILVLTTESSEEKKARAREAGATGWIVKPFDPEKLVAAVFGIDIMAIREIRAWSPATRLPRVPHYVAGVVKLRGRVLPGIDLAARQ